jgi:hypothetical protein
LLLAGIAVGCSSCGDDDPVGPTDKTRPTVVSTVPVMDDSLVALTTSVSATFSEPMNPATMGAGVLTLNPSVAGSTSYSDRTVTFTPDNPLQRDVTYTATVATSAADTANNRLAEPYVWEFSTFQDTIPPTIDSTYPPNHDSAASRFTWVMVYFSERMDESTLGAGSFSIQPHVPGTFTIEPQRLIWKPSAMLDLNTLYTATISTAATDSAGNALASDYAFDFYTTPDTTKPTASITSPDDDDVVGDSVLIEVDATDNARINGVFFYIDGALVPDATDEEAPYQYTWDASGENVGSTHTIFAQAFDESGNFAYSDTITVHYLWKEVITDGDEGIPRNLSNIFVRSTATQVQFRVMTHNGWGEYNDSLLGIDVVIWIDADQSALTGDTDTDNGTKPINDIGADYQMVIGFHGLYFQYWDGSVWQPPTGQGVEDLVMANDTNVFEVSITRGRIGGTGDIDLVVANVHVTTNQWDFAPDSGHARVSIKQSFTPPTTATRTPEQSATSETRRQHYGPFD